MWFLKSLEFFEGRDAGVSSSPRRRCKHPPNGSVSHDASRGADMPMCLEFELSQGMNLKNTRTRGKIHYEYTMNRSARMTAVMAR